MVVIDNILHGKPLSAGIDYYFDVYRVIMK